ncbi:MAG: hypothetical protein KBC30_08755 [Planctomycetes bacterium]|jgi:small nuclear ribonucleoprotein (snRNP)-like protein|nr:hypothetical protein [Planctomycetota bacterium]HNZ66173.1 hypothetical protein [Planctomycetota bacterium]HPY75704.1 hypothetical protein [Planctomycetota bacterium]HQB01253.1 hypothetical protein [Planctomycetota bacterium]HRU52246.1 hypothetical protein [Planctomycetota bacterium]
MSELQDYIGKPVVVDTKSEYMYIGILLLDGEEFLTLNNVDVHDHSSTSTTKEFYIMESAKFDIKKNRKQVKVRKQEMISISLLEDVLVF